MAQTLGTERDAGHLRRAIELAREARGMTSPNPLVGAVIVKDGRVIGEGFHAAAGLPHAERAALGACSQDPAGATMYVSLEPCCHTGRTPPCTDAIVEARIKRVVVASDDPSDEASGRGLGILRDEGISVEMVDGDVAAAARLINQPFRKQARTGRPLVVMKTAMTLDGTVAGSTGDSRWSSGDVQSLLLEGGPHLAGAFLDAGEVDEMRVFIAPIVAGGRQARSPIEGQGFQLIGAARRALAREVEEIGDDALITARLTEW